MKTFKKDFKAHVTMFMRTNNALKCNIISAPSMSKKCAGKDENYIKKVTLPLPTAFQNLRTYDVGFITEKLKSLMGAEIFVDTQHFRPWVYHELNLYLLNMIKWYK